MPRVLLVEDNDLNRDMLQRRLARRGYEVVLAINGAEALAVARAGNVDLLLMDLRLPDVSGWDVTRRLRGDEETKTLPIIALTAHARPSDRQEALDAGCDEYDTKPVDMPRLLEKIERLLRARGITPPASSAGGDGQPTQNGGNQNA